MLKGATQPCQSANGSYVESQGLSLYQSLGYVPYDIDSHVSQADSITGSPEAVWGSAATTLEYTVDDFAIAQFAARVMHNPTVYSEFMARSGNWRNLYDPSTGLIEPRYANGQFPTPTTPQKEAVSLRATPISTPGWCPRTRWDSSIRWVASAKASGRLHYFLRELNGSTHSEHALLGNEPTLQTPWLFDWASRPYLTQETVRRALTSLYSTRPDGYPGNDDLGTMSAWYVFGALGLYPEVPGVGLLAVGSPLFARASIALANHKRALITASAHTYVRPKPKKGKKHRRPAKPRRVTISPSSAPYIDAAQFNGHGLRAALDQLLCARQGRSL